jgi:hypothetical protein
MPSVSSAPTEMPISIVSISTMELTLYSKMSSYYFDQGYKDFKDELQDLLNKHISKEIRLSLPNKYRLLELDMVLMPIHDQGSGLRSSSYFSTQTFLLSGKLLFIGTLVPEIDSADAIILQSFSKRALSLCLELLQTTESAELRSIDDVEISIFKSALPTISASTESEVPKQEPWYSWFTEKDNLMIIAVAVAGLCLLVGLAMIVATASRNSQRDRGHTRS